MGKRAKARAGLQAALDPEAAAAEELRIAADALKPRRRLDEYADLARTSLKALSEADLRAQLPTGTAVLTLSNNYIEEFALRLSPALPALTSLDLSCNELTALPPLDAALGLCTLVLAKNHIVDMAAPPLQLPRLTELDVQHNHLTAVAALPGCTALERLSLSCNPIMRVDPQASFPRLQQLGLYGHRVPELGPLEALLGRCPELSRLSVGAGVCTKVAQPQVPCTPAQVEWRARLLRAAPALCWIDCEFVQALERRSAEGGAGGEEDEPAAKRARGAELRLPPGFGWTLDGIF